MRNPTCKHYSLIVVMLIITPLFTKRSGRGHALHDQADVHITRLARLGLTKTLFQGPLSRIPSRRACQLWRDFLNLRLLRLARLPHAHP